MNKKYKFLLSFILLFIIVFLFIYSYFGILLYKKYIYLWKVVKKIENDKYLWPLSNNVSKKIIENCNLEGDTLLIGVGSCSILDKLVKHQKGKIYVIDSNQYLLELAEEKYEGKCHFIHDKFEFYQFDILFDNVISTLPHKEYSLQEIETFLNRYLMLSKQNVIFFESKMPHVKNTFNKLFIHNKNKDKKIYDYKIIKNIKNIPPINLCLIKKIIQSELQQPHSS